MRPRVGHQQVREYRTALAAADPWTGRLAALVVAGSVDHDVMNAFLVEIGIRFPRRYCIVFLDGAGAHISHDLVVPPNLHVEVLPPHSPELNPVESLWDYIREHYFANRVFSTIDRVRNRLCTAFRELDATPQQVQSIASFDWIKAAKLT